MIGQYVKAATAQLRRQDLMRVPDPNLPAAMRDASVAPEEDWVAWKPIPSTVTDEELDQLESELGQKYPPLYRCFLLRSHFYDLTERGLRFKRHVIGRWKDELRKAYCAWYPDRIVGIGLIPFGDDALMDAGPVCFDTRDRLPDGDCPVVIWDHEWVGRSKEVRPLFSSSRAMFRALTFCARHDIDFIYHDEDDPSYQLEEKRRLLRDFLALDPNGAGRTARRLWTCWGVTPAEQ